MNLISNRGKNRKSLKKELESGLERLFLKKNVEEIEQESARKIQDIELTYGTAAGRKNIEVFDKIFNAKLKIKKKHQKDINQKYLGAFKNNQFVQELNTFTINSRKHAFKKNKVSGSVLSEHYDGITKTEFEQR